MNGADSSASTRIHPTALVASSAALGRDTEVGPYAVIEEDVEIGDHCRIAAHAVLKQGTRMGDGNQVFEGAVIGGPPQDLKYSGEPTRLIIGNENVFREGVTAHRSTSASHPTRIGDRNYLMAYVHIAHDCRLGDGVIIANNVCLAGHIEIEDQVFISGGVVIHQFTRLGQLSMIGGNAKVIQDVLPFHLVDGIPACTRGLNLVGLRRARLPRPEISALKQSCQVLFSDASKLEQKLQRLDEIDSESVRRLATFIRGSQRGFCGADFTQRRQAAE